MFVYTAFNIICGCGDSATFDAGCVRKGGDWGGGWGRGRGQAEWGWGLKYKVFGLCGYVNVFAME